MTRYVGVDLHRRRSVLVVLEADGTELWTKRIDNDPMTLGLEIERAGPEPEVVLEATWGWYWAADVIAAAGGRVHLAHPLGIKGFENRRVKNDRIDARLLADLLRMGRLPESWIAPEGIRYQRELIRYRRKLSQLRAGLKAQVHAVLGKEGLRPPINHLWGPGGTVWLDATDMAEAYETRVRSLRTLIGVYDTEITQLDARIAHEFEDHEGYPVIQQLNGVGPVLAGIFCAELGDVGRFRSAKAVCSWAGLTPRHRESDTTVHRGPITKQGSGLVRWAAIEAISRNHGDDPIRNHYRRVAERRGLNKGRVAAARKLLTLVYYGLRDGEIRSLAAQTT